MAFSLSNWFKGKPGAPGSETPDENAPAEAAAAPAVAAPAAPAVPPPAVRKVMPNSVQPVSLRTPGAPRPSVLPVSSPTPQSERVSPVLMPAPRGKISFGGSDASAPGAAAPAVPAAPSAMADVIVSLEVGDFFDRLPPGFVQAGAVDRQRRIDFRASELYSDLTKGRASVPASVIYQKCPELFTRPVSEEEDTEVSLPLQKLVEQMSQAFQTRTDQVAEDNVGEIETPFLQVALEDSARLPKAQGTTAGALRSPHPPAVTASPLNEPPHRPHRTGQISTISPLRTAPEPPPMQAAPGAASVAPINAAKRPPSTVRASVAGGKIRLSGPAMPNRMVPVSVPPPAAQPAMEAAPAPAPELPPSASQRILPPLQVGGPAVSPSHQVSKKTARIQIPPISLRGPGAGARPAAPSAVSVQPSPVPVRPGPSAEPATPPTIAFRSTPPPGTRKMPHSFAPPPLRPAVPPPAFPSAPPVLTAPPTTGLPGGFPAATDDRKISLSLAAVLRGLPLSSLTVEPNSVPDDVRVTLPFSLVEPQLAQGRVSIPHAVFAGSLPESHREVLASNSGLSEIPLPLQEVFQNLPAAALAIRQDQLAEEVGNAYPTPFSQKAEEDAQRLGTPARDLAAAVPEAAAPAAPAPEPAIDRPLPADPVVDEEPAPKITAAAIPAPAPEPVVEEAEEAPSEEFANLFVEEPPAPVRDLPLDFGGDKPAAVVEEAMIPEPVEARATDEEKSEPGTSEEPEVTAEEATEPPESKPEVRAEEKPVEAPAAIVLPALMVEEKHEPALVVEEKREELTPPPESKAPEAAAAEPAPEPAPTEEAPDPVEPEPAIAPALVAQRNGHAPEPATPARQTAPVLASVQDSALQSLFMTEDELDAKGVVKHVCALPGVEGCSVMFEDGLQLAGNFPSEADVEGFSAMAPPFFKRTRNFTGETNLGSLRAFTLYTESGLYSFFMHEHICLSVRHTGRGFLPGVREKLELVTRELARMYATALQAE